jgi:hypothetical protein
MLRRSSLIPAAFLAGALVALSLARGADAPPPGFEPLFDGASLAGWQGGSTHDPRNVTAEQQAAWDREVPAHWQAVDGQLVSDGHGPHLATRREFGDFELWVDWNLAPRGDSGIYLRGCPQVQLWDPGNEEAHANGSDKGSGALWNNAVHERFPLQVADKPCGEWNRMYVRMVGPYVTVVLNDVKVVDDVIMENYYDRKLPVFPRGTIHLQTHGSETRFRSLYVREIPHAEANALLAEIRGGEVGFQDLFNGRDLQGWRGAVNDYEAVDGAIRCRAGRGGTLLTDQEFADFAVRLEFQLPPGGNNGLAIRTPAAGGDPAFAGVELQVLDDDAEKYAGIEPYQAHGSAYGLAAAHRGYLRPTGAWNYQEVVVRGDAIDVHLNGYLILSTNLAEVRQQPLDGREHPGASRAAGHFGFCGHGDPVAFRRIRVKPL